MRARDRSWRQRVLWMLGMIDKKLEEQADSRDILTICHVMDLRDRLAGSLGSEAGNASTQELRERAVNDMMEAAMLLGAEQEVWITPHSPERRFSIERDLGAFRWSWPKTGDQL